MNVAKAIYFPITQTISLTATADINPYAASPPLGNPHNNRDYSPTHPLHTLVQMVDNGLGLTMLLEMALDAGIQNGTNVVARPLKNQNANRAIAHLRGPAPLGSQNRLQPGADVRRA